VVLVAHRSVCLVARRRNLPRVRLFRIVHRMREDPLTISRSKGHIGAGAYCFVADLCTRACSRRWCNLEDERDDDDLFSPNMPNRRVGPSGIVVAASVGCNFVDGAMVI
jgi:hypothetical protein